MENLQNPVVIILLIILCMIILPKIIFFLIVGAGSYLLYRIIQKYLNN